jgi:hypothetical protein
LGAGSDGRQRAPHVTGQHNQRQQQASHEAKNDPAPAETSHSVCRSDPGQTPSLRGYGTAVAVRISSSQSPREKAKAFVGSPSLALESDRGRGGAQCLQG